MSTNALPISRKALNGFLQRIRQVYSLDPEKTSAMERALRLYLDNDNSYRLAIPETDPTYAGPVEVRIDPTGYQPLSYSIKYPAPATSSGTRSQRRAEERKAKKDLLAAMRRLRNGINP